MTTDRVAVLIALGLGFVAWTAWYLSTALQSAFDRTMITSVILRDIPRRVLLISTSRLQGNVTTRRYILGSGFIAFWPLLLAVVATGPARWIQLGSFVACLVFWTYGFVLFRRLGFMSRSLAPRVGADGQPSQQPSILDDIIGKEIRRLRRVLYVVDGQIESENGPIELSFVDGSVITLNAGPDGEMLSVKPSSWIDPFEWPMSDENRAFVGRSGKWTAFDVSREPRFHAITGHTVLKVEPRMNNRGATGVGIVTSSGQLRAEVGADELIVTVD